MLKKIKYLFEAILIYTFFLFAKIIGLRLSRVFFSHVFKIIGPFLKSKKIINKNLSNFSSSISIDTKKKIISSMWSNYGMTFIEYVFLKQFRENDDHIQIEGEIILENIVNNKKPVIFISGHFANFELMSMEITKRKINLATIYRPLNNFFINPFMEYLRKKYICKNQIKKGLIGVKETMNYLNKRYSIALMIDQRVSEGEKIKFFNNDALTTTLPAQLALKYNIDIIPVFIERNKSSLFKIKVYEPIKPSLFKNKMEMTKNLNNVLENMIIKNPNQWIWTHDRWK